MSALALGLAFLLLALPAGAMGGEWPPGAGDNFPHDPPRREIKAFVEPDYPVEEWLLAHRGKATFLVKVDSLGNVTDAVADEGREPFTGSARRALAHWRFAAARTPGWNGRDHAVQYFDFDPEEAVFSEEESRIIPGAPPALVSYPFPCPDSWDPTLPNYYPNLVRMRIDSSGFVRDVRFMEGAPPDSNAVLASARRWVFRPFVAPDGPRAGHAIPVWVAVPMTRSCSRSGRTLLARPDSAMLGAMDNALSARLMELRPSPQERGRCSWPVDLPDKADQGFVSHFENSDMISGRWVPADPVVPRLKKILQSPAAFGGPMPAQSHRRPEPEYALIILKTNRGAGMEVLISLEADFIEVRSGRTVLFVPIRAVRREVRALVEDLFVVKR